MQVLQDEFGDRTDGAENGPFAEAAGWQVWYQNGVMTLRAVGLYAETHLSTVARVGALAFAERWHPCFTPDPALVSAEEMKGIEARLRSGRPA